MKLMLVEDDLPLGGSLRSALQAQGHAVLWLRHGADAVKFLRLEPVDLLLLDITLPGPSGLEILAQLRARGDATPVMLLTARDGLDERVAGLDGGADDYLAKPFAVEELLARIRVLQRRHRQQLSALWRIGALCIDTARRRVSVQDREVSLSAREYAVLVALATQPGTVLTRADIERATAMSEGSDSNAIDVHIYQLRRKLGGQRIGTVRGVGYVLENAADPKVTQATPITGASASASASALVPAPTPALTGKVIS